MDYHQTQQSYYSLIPLNQRPKILDHYRSDDLSSYYKLFGGPSWLGKSLHKKNKLVRHKLPNQYNLSRPRNSTSATTVDLRHWHNDSYRDAKFSTRGDFYFYLKKRRYKNTSYIHELFNEAVDYVDQEIVKASPYLNTIYDIDNHNSIRNRYYDWVKILRSLTYERGGISFFWISWLAGPGRDFRISIPKSITRPYSVKLEKQSKNKDYTIDCTRIWMRTKLMEAARQHFSDTWGNDALNIEEPKYLLKTDPMDGGLVLYEVRCNESLKNILKEYF